MPPKILDLTVADLSSSRLERVGGPTLARIVREIATRTELEPGDRRSLRDIVREAALLGHSDAIAVALGDRVGAEPRPRRRR
jgi:hypothetical protein